MVTICGVPTGFLYCPPHVLKSQSKGTTKKELRLIFQAKFNPSFLSPKINICSGKLWHKMMFLIMFFLYYPYSMEPLLSIHPVLRGHHAISCG